MKELLKMTNLLLTTMILLQVMEVQYVRSLKTMHVAFKWDQITFVFDSAEQREQLEASGVFIPGESAPYDVDFYGDKIFVAMPRVLNGSAVTLATIENTTQRNNPRLQPYPSWSWHANNNGCDGLTSVFRMRVDDCGRLWVIDSGLDLSLGRSRVICPPQLVIFNATTDELIMRYRFSSNNCSDSLMLNVVTESMDNQCTDDVYAYIADARALQLVVFHLQSQRSWPVSNALFYPEVAARNFVVNRVPFSMMTGVLGLAVSPCIDEACDRYLFFHSFSGFIQGCVRTSVLRNESLFLSNARAAAREIKEVGSSPRQVAGEAMSKEGFLFFGLVGDNTLNCWNYRTQFKRNNIRVLEHDRKRISIVLGIKVITAKDGNQLLKFVSSNMQTLFSGNYTRNSTYPVYVISGNVADIIKSN